MRSGDGCNIEHCSPLRLFGSLRGFCRERHKGRSSPHYVQRLQQLMEIPETSVLWPLLRLLPIIHTGSLWSHELKCLNCTYRIFTPIWRVDERRFTFSLYAAPLFIIISHVRAGLRRITLRLPIELDPARRQESLMLTYILLST